MIQWLRARAASSADDGPEGATLPRLEGSVGADSDPIRSRSVTSLCHGVRDVQDAGHLAATEYGTGRRATDE
jgi:hypothetical protein